MSIKLTDDGRHVLLPISSYDLLDELMSGVLSSPEELESEYGFTKKENPDGIIVSTNAVILVKGSMFLAHFKFNKEREFLHLILLPIAGVNDNYQDERRREENRLTCELIALKLGGRIGRFQVKSSEYNWRDAGEIASKYAIVIQEHPLFAEIEQILDDSSLTDEELSNFMTHFTDAIDKYKESL